MSETLTYKDTITRIGYTTVDGERIMQYSMTIDADNPEEMNLSNVKLDKDAYKAKREICRADMAEFEDAAYLLQEQYVTQKAIKTVGSGVTE